MSPCQRSCGSPPNEQANYNAIPGIRQPRRRASAMSFFYLVLRADLKRYRGWAGTDLSVDAEEAGQHLGSLFGNLFREKVAGVDPMSLNNIAPGLPKRDRSGLRDIPSIERPLRPPHCQERTHDPTTARAIRLVMLAVDRCGGAVLLADGMGVVGISKRLHIGCTNLRREHSGRRS